MWNGGVRKLTPGELTQVLSFLICTLESECKLHPRDMVKIIFMDANAHFIFSPLSLLLILSPSASFFFLNRVDFLIPIVLLGLPWWFKW